MGSRIDPAGSTAQRPEVLDANAGRRTLFGAERRRSGCSRGCSGGVGRGACSSAGGPAGGQARGRAVGHSFAARGRHGVLRQRGGRGQSKGATAPGVLGVMTAATRTHHRPGRLTPTRVFGVCGPPGRGRGDHAARRRPARSVPGPRPPRRCCGPGGRRPGRGSGRCGCGRGGVARPRSRPSAPVLGLSRS